MAILINDPCTSAGANIVGAQVSTTKDGFALDTFRLQREFDRSDDEERRAGRIAATICDLIEGRTEIESVLAEKPRQKEALKAFTVEPQVIIDNSLSELHTVLEVDCIDRPGLLYDLTREIADLRLDVVSAHIATFGEKVVDVFYVTGMDRKKITSAAKQTAIRHRLMGVLSTDVTEDA